MRIARVLLIVASLCVLAAPALAKVRARDMTYFDLNKTKLKGYLAWDDKIQGKRPGVLVVHEWWGHNKHARDAARRLAKAGYVAFALDMYGDGKVTTHPDSAEAFMTEALKGATTVPERFGAALQQLVADQNVDTSRIGAIGYCFGGAVVLSMARMGADLKAVATFHGALATSSPANPGKIKPKILVMTGSADPMVPATAVAAFEKEMKEAGASYRVVTYPGAKHGFTNPFASHSGVPGLAYNRSADKKSWGEMLRFFRANL